MEAMECALFFLLLVEKIPFFSQASRSTTSSSSATSTAGSQIKTKVFLFMPTHPSARLECLNAMRALNERCCRDWFEIFFPPKSPPHQRGARAIRCSRLFPELVPVFTKKQDHVPLVSLRPPRRLSTVLPLQKSTGPTKEPTQVRSECTCQLHVHST